MLIFIKLFIKWECRHGKCIHLHVTILGKWINAYACLVTKDMLVLVESSSIIFSSYINQEDEKSKLKKKSKGKVKTHHIFIIKYGSI